jgi:hypothetical protein
MILLSLGTGLQAATQTVVSLGSTWHWRKGTNEASSPVSAWRTNGFNDASWPSGAAPFSYGTNSTGRDDGVTSGTVVSDMINKYGCIFLRQAFTVTNLAEVQSASLSVAYDDGFVMWVNGVEVQRQNVSVVSPLYTNFAVVAHEADPSVVLAVTNWPQSFLVEGSNVVAVQLFNNNLPSSDLRFDAALRLVRVELPPAMAAVSPAPDASLSSLSQVRVTFTKPVFGVDAGDLLINGQPATVLQGACPTNVFTFGFTQPSPGWVQLWWSDQHGIVDSNGVAFDASAAAARWTYTLQDTVAPRVTDLVPTSGIKLSRLTQVSVTFSEPVQGVEASDLLINGLPAASVAGAGSGPYVFQFAQPAAGAVRFEWASTHGISDLAATPNAFGGGSWTNLLDPAAVLPTVRINEFLTANVSSNGLRDEFGELQDWIELYNSGSNAVDLAGCALTDDADEPGKWVFPSVTLGAGQYLVVFASGLDRKLVGGTNRLHTSFSLGSGGDYLGLWSAEVPRVAIDEFAPEFPEQRNDCSYGRDASGVLRYFATPTPGAANGTSTISGVVSNVQFSVARGFFTEPFNLELATATSGASIRYTTNGSLPTETEGLLYTNPVAIDRLTTLRAAAFATNMLPSIVATHTYLFLSNVLTQPTNPAGFPIDYSWLTDSSRPSDYGMDPRIVTNALYAAEMMPALLSLPTISVVLPVDQLFGTNGFYRGVDPLSTTVRPEKACSVELILPSGSKGFQLDAGIKLRGGGSSRSTMKHPVDLKFKSKYGPGKLHYSFFADSPVEEFDSLVLRSDYNNHWTHGDGTQRSHGGLVRDAYFKDLQTAMGDFTSRSRYVHLYLNGLYWGVYNPCEDLDNNFAAAYMGGDDEDYDVVKASNGQLVVDGDSVALNAMQALNNSGLASLSQYTRIQEYLDVAQFADYYMLQAWGGDVDWNQTANWSAIRPRQAGAGFKFMCWDSERTLEGTNDTANAGGPLGLQASLTNSAEYRLLFADRVHRHFFNNGALTTNSVAAVWLARAGQIQQAMVPESARWGDSVPNGKSALSPLPYAGYSSSVPYFSRDENWLGEQGRLLANYFPARSGIMLGRFRSTGLYPLLDAPEFNLAGGRVAAGFSLSMSAPSGTIYYTTNGTDPRVYGSGAVTGVARIYTNAVRLNSSMVVKARALSGSTWSALCEGTFTVGEVGVPLRITEIMYNPPGGNAYDFIEVRNIGVLPLDVSGFSFSGITYLFPSGTILAAGEVRVLANSANPTAFAARYPGVSVSGYFSDNLSNGGERIAIYDAYGRLVTAVNYDDEAGWPTAADGGGYSLEVIDPRADADAPANWRASSMPNGTPGLPPVAPAVAGDIVLSEVMAENVFAVANGGSFPDWIELQNRGSNAVSLLNWSLTDDSKPRKFVFPATTISPGGFLVVWCDTSSNAPGLHTGFSLDKTGESVFLYDAATNRVDALTFGLQLADYSLARFGEAWALANPTPNATNVSTPVAASSEVTMNEWLANPPVGGSDWLELFNRSYFLPAALGGIVVSNINGACPLRALSFLAPRAYCQLLADEQPGADHLGIKLPAAGDTLVLQDATGLELERVTYGSQAESVSQGRLPDGGTNVVAFVSTSSPGASNYLPLADADGDGLPDDWEMAHGTNPHVADAQLDSDGDGMSNWQEYLAGTDPQSSASCLKLTAASGGASGVKLGFLAVSNHTYSILFSGSLTAPNWSRLTNLALRPTNRWESVQDAIGTSNRFYRLTTPQWP